LNISGENSDKHAEETFKSVSRFPLAQNLFSNLMQKANKNQVDDDDLPPELEDLPEELTGKKSTKTVGGGNIKYGDFAEVKEEKPIDQALVQAEKPKKEASTGTQSHFPKDPRTQERIF
jgi:hypothetical protein